MHGGKSGKLSKVETTPSRRGEAMSQQSPNMSGETHNSPKIRTGREGTMDPEAVEDINVLQSTARNKKKNLNINQALIGNSAMSKQNRKVQC